MFTKARQTGRQQVTYWSDDGSSETRVGGDWTWRNQNPGNIGGRRWADRHGAIGKAGGFAVFPSYETGKSAIFDLLNGPDYKNLSIWNAIPKYAPSSDGNDVQNYRQTIQKITGFDLNRKIRDLTKAEFTKLVNAIMRAEGGMRLLNKLLFIFSLVVAAATVSASPTPHASEYFVTQRIVLGRKTDGLDGSLEIWRDKRLTDFDIKLMKEHDPDNDPAHSLKFKKRPVRSAIVVLRPAKRANSQIIQFLRLEKSYAILKEKSIESLHKRIFLVTQDFGASLGSYNGPITQLLEVKGKSLTWMKAIDKNSKAAAPIALMRSLKSAWNFDSKTDDILEVRCRPHDSPEGFITYYSRYHLGEDGWTRVSRSTSTYWEAENGNQELDAALPAIGNFPAGDQ